jgi:uncharacterized protein YdeI (YjbR/CyaY-like superfamily)
VELPVLELDTVEGWDAWLVAEAGSSPGVWLTIGKRGAGISYGDALDVALTHGWIDGQKRALDDDHWLQRFTPRRPGSRWSKINTERVERLIAAGRMRPAGTLAVEEARADGRWEAAYAGSRQATVPPDLQRALDQVPAAAAFFGGLDAANRYAVLYRIEQAKRPETRARRIADFVAMLAEGRTIHPTGGRRRRPG